MTVDDASARDACTTPQKCPTPGACADSGECLQTGSGLLDCRYFKRKWCANCAKGEHAKCCYALPPAATAPLALSGSWVWHNRPKIG